MIDALFNVPFAKWPQTICYVGNTPGLRLFLQNEAIQHVWYSYERLLIDDVRELRSELTQKMPVDTAVRAMVIDAATAGIEPQNALLKTIEEPAPGHKIILCFPTLEGILPTIISRSTIVREQFQAGVNNPKETMVDLVAWLEMSVLDRMRSAEDVVKKSQKNQTSGLLRAETLRAVIRLEQFLYNGNLGSTATLASIFADLAHFRTYLQNQGASPKYILEYLALSLPAK